MDFVFTKIYIALLTLNLNLMLITQMLMDYRGAFLNNYNRTNMLNVLTI